MRADMGAGCHRRKIDDSAFSEVDRQRFRERNVAWKAGCERADRLRDVDNFVSAWKQCRTSADGITC